MISGHRGPAAIVQGRRKRAGSCGVGRSCSSASPAAQRRSSDTVLSELFRPGPAVRAITNPHTVERTTHSTDMAGHHDHPIEFGWVHTPQPTNTPSTASGPVQVINSTRPPEWLAESFWTGGSEEEFMTATTHSILQREEVAELAAQLRVDSIRAASSAGSGHPSSSMSAADLLATLMSRHLRYDWDQPESPGNDHLIFSKGHASPLLYSVYKAAGVVSDEELMNDYRRFGKRLEGHPTPVLPWVDVATGSLGQGLPDGVGVALAGKYLDKASYRVWVLTGDSEFAEGSMWEALDKAGIYGLTNLVTIVDVNRLGQRGETALGWDLDTYAARVEAFGARAVIIDGHDIGQIDEALAQADGKLDRPLVILARTLKGKGYSVIEDELNWHGKPMPDDKAEEAIAELGGERNLVVRGPKPPVIDRPEPSRGSAELPTFEKGEEVATRKAYGPALAALGAADPRIVALDGEVSNSTGVADFIEAHPDRFFEMFIAEQQMVAAATGMSSRGYLAFASSFAAFLTRAADFIRMAPVSRADLRLVGSHAGVEIGADGPSQMGDRKSVG